MKPNIDKYRYCNYCKHFKIDTNRQNRQHRTCLGYCSIKSTRPYYYEHFNSPACDDNFEMTIHNWCGIEYPEYINEYSCALNINFNLWWNIIKSDSKNSK